MNQLQKFCFLTLIWIIKNFSPGCPVHRAGRPFVWSPGAVPAAPGPGGVPALLAQRSGTEPKHGQVQWRHRPSEPGEHTQTSTGTVGKKKKFSCFQLQNSVVIIGGKFFAAKMENMKQVLVEAELRRCFLPAAAG